MYYIFVKFFKNKMNKISNINDVNINVDNSIYLLFFNRKHWLI